ncbi:MAG: hypothetical protein KDB88_10000 [Flavobacteriales bacterium]|nr:hypothetical protein [Flavobacteriales bacterium]
MRTGPLDRDTFEAIEAYVLGRMDKEECRRFEERMRHDQALQQEVQLEREHIHAVELAGVVRQIDRIAGSDNSDEAESGRDGVTRSPMRWLAYAAAVAVVFTVAWYLLRPPLHEQLYAEFHSPDPGLPVTMGADRNYEFQDAMTDFKMGRYPEAVNKWSDLQANGEGSDTLSFYLGCAYLELDEQAMAKQAFHQVREFPGSGFHYKADWSLFLITLREDPNAVASWSVDPASPYADRMRTVLQRLSE